MTTSSLPAPEGRAEAKRRMVKPGGALRFAVGSSHGPRASTWRVWTSKNSNDIYVAVRAIAGTQKISLHQSGSWQHSFINEEKRKQWAPENPTRHLDLWNRPDPLAEGITRGYTIQVPRTELRIWSEPEPGDITFIPDPGHGYWVLIEIFIVAPGAAPGLIIDDAFDVGTLALSDGGSVRIMAMRRVPPRVAAVGVAMGRDELMAKIKAGEWDISDAENPWAGLHGHRNDDGSRMTTELAVRKAPPGSVVICSGWPAYGRRMPDSLRFEHRLILGLRA